MLFTSEEPTIEIGIAGVTAAKAERATDANVKRMDSSAETGDNNDDRTAIRAVLKDAIPEFGSRLMELPARNTIHS
jgi:hypothetical protein